MLPGMAGVRRLLDGTGPYSGLALAAFVVGVAMMLSILLSPNERQWWLDAHRVQGQEVGGAVVYSFHGQNGSVNDPRSDTRTGPRTVYVIAAAPLQGSLTNTPTVALDWTITAGPALIGVVLLAFGFVRRSQMRSRRTVRDEIDRFGYGIPSEVVQRIVSDRAHPRRQSPSPRTDSRDWRPDG